MTCASAMKAVESMGLSYASELHWKSMRVYAKKNIKGLSELLTCRLRHNTTSCTEIMFQNSSRDVYTEIVHSTQYQSWRLRASGLPVMSQPPLF